MCQIVFLLFVDVFLVVVKGTTDKLVPTSMVQDEPVLELHRDVVDTMLTPPTIEIVGFLGGSCKAHHHAACQAASYAVSHKKPRVWLSMSIQPLQVDQHTCLRSRLFECILL